MKKIVFSLFASALTYSAHALPQGSSDRCKGENWAHIDNLLPERSKDGGYSPPLDPAKQKLEKASPDAILQSAVDHVLSFYDLCDQRVAGVGGWEDLIGTNLCERLALYNVFHDDVFSENADESSKKGRLMFDPEDLKFLQSIFKACRPTTQRWWNYPLVVHVSFKPTPEEYQEIGQKVGVKKKEN